MKLWKSPLRRLAGLALGGLLLTAGGPASAQLIGPDAFNYRAIGVTSPFQDISGTGTQILPNNDDEFQAVPIGFDFRFYGQTFDTAFVSPNGLITFTAGSNTFFNTDLNTTAGPFAPDADNSGQFGVPAIAVLWDDWATFVGADAVYHQTVAGPLGAAFIVQWNVVRPFGNEVDFATFQAVLFENTDQILFRYLDVEDTTDLGFGGGGPFGSTATIGIRDRDGHRNGRRLQWSFNQASIANGRAISFFPSDRSDAFGYNVLPVASDFEDISGIGTVLDFSTGLPLPDDDAFVPFPVGFNFRFYGQNFPGVFVSINGVLSFTDGNVDFVDDDLDSQVTTPDVPTIAALWDDWFDDGTATIRVAVLGPVGQRRFIVQWNQVHPFSGVGLGRTTFQAVLFEGSHSILFRYLDVEALTGPGGLIDGGPFASSATIGIRDTGAPANDRHLQWSFNAHSIRNGTALLFFPPNGQNGSARLLASGTVASSGQRFILNGRVARGVNGVVNGQLLYSFTQPGQRSMYRSVRITGFAVFGNQAILTGQLRGSGAAADSIVDFVAQFQDGPDGTSLQLSNGFTLPPTLLRYGQVVLTR